MPRLEARRPEYSPGDTIWYDVSDSYEHDTHDNVDPVVEVNARSGEVISAYHTDPADVNAWVYVTLSHYIDAMGKPQPIYDVVAQTNIIPNNR